MNARGPLIAAITILLLPLLYIATYFANVQPGLILAPNSYSYHFGGAWAARMYWPVEVVDRRIRPDTWDPWEDVGGPGFINPFESSLGCRLGLLDEEPESPESPICAECFAGQ